MEVPDGVLVVTIRATSHLISEDIEVFVDRQSVVGVTCGHEVGNRARWNTQSAENWTENWFGQSVLTASKGIHYKCIQLTGTGNGREDPALSVFDWFGSIAQVMLKDLVTTSPYPRANTIFEGAFPFAFQQTETFIGVNLIINDKQI